MTTEIKICMGSACFARGNDKNAEFIEKYIRTHNLDAKIELIGARCENKCAHGPNLYVDGECVNNVDEAKIIEILEKIEKGS